MENHIITESYMYLYEIEHFKINNKIYYDTIYNKICTKMYYNKEWTEIINFLFAELFFSTNYQLVVMTDYLLTQKLLIIAAVRSLSIFNVLTIVHLRIFHY